MHKTAPMMLFLGGVLLKGCFQCFPQEPNTFGFVFGFFCPLERKIFLRDSRAMGRMCWRGAPPLGWHLFFTLFCLLDLVSAFSLWFELGLCVYLLTRTFGATGERNEQVKVYVVKEQP